MEFCVFFVITPALTLALFLGAFCGKTFENVKQRYRDAQYILLFVFISKMFQLITEVVDVHFFSILMSQEESDTVP